MKKKELDKWFTEKFLKGTCFPTIKELLKDKTNYEINIVRCLIAVDLTGIYQGAVELNAHMEEV